MRVLVTCSALLFAFAATTPAQEQERKLIERILKPDLSLQNSVQNKQFVARGNTVTKQARTKPFYVAHRRPEKEFPTGSFRAKEFATKNSRFQNNEANLRTRTQIAKADVPYRTSAYRGIEPAREAEKSVETSEFAGSTRPFLIKGKSQKALSQQDRPLTIDEVRELLNKNK